MRTVVLVAVALVAALQGAESALAAAGASASVEVELEWVPRDPRLAVYDYVVSEGVRYGSEPNSGATFVAEHVATPITIAQTIRARARATATASRPAGAERAAVSGSAFARGGLDVINNNVVSGRVEPLTGTVRVTVRSWQIEGSRNPGLSEQNSASVRVSVLVPDGAGGVIEIEVFSNERALAGSTGPSTFSMFGIPFVRDIPVTLPGTDINVFEIVPIRLLVSAGAAAVSFDTLHTVPLSNIRLSPAQRSTRPCARKKLTIECRVVTKHVVATRTTPIRVARDESARVRWRLRSRNGYVGPVEISDTLSKGLSSAKRIRLRIDRIRPGTVVERHYTVRPAVPGTATMRSVVRTGSPLTTGAPSLFGSIGVFDPNWVSQPPQPPPPPAPPPPPPPPPVKSPNLVVSALQSGLVTITNLGDAAAGPFTVRLTSSLPQTQPISLAINGLAAGASTTAQFGLVCKGGAVTAVADSAEVVSESNEGDNTRTESC